MRHMGIWIFWARISCSSWFKHWSYDCFWWLMLRNFHQNFHHFLISLVLGRFGKITQPWIFGVFFCFFRGRGASRCFQHGHGWWPQLWRGGRPSRRITTFQNSWTLLQAIAAHEDVDLVSLLRSPWVGCIRFFVSNPFFFSWEKWRKNQLRWASLVPLVQVWLLRGETGPVCWPRSLEVEGSQKWQRRHWKSYLSSVVVKGQIFEGEDLFFGMIWFIGFVSFSSKNYITGSSKCVKFLPFGGFFG